MIRLGLLYGMKRKDEILYLTYPATNKTSPKETSYQHRYAVLRENLATYLMAVLEVEGEVDQNLKAADAAGESAIGSSPAKVDAGQS